MPRTILLLGSLDSKDEEYAFLREQILARGCGVLTLNTGVLGSTQRFEVDIQADEVAQAAKTTLDALRRCGDRGEAMQAMARGAACVAGRLYEEGRFAGIAGMGGSGGTSVITSAMRALPLGVPKVCVSTVASGDTAAYVGPKDVVMIPAITDVAGLNRISRVIISNAAGAICGMVQSQPPADNDDRPIIVASMFGNTTACVDACRAQLDQAGYEVLVFHATGTGGRIMESLIDGGWADGCLDITTTEWADTLCGGIFSAGEDRLSAAGRRGVPQLVVPGCVDMVNFGPLDSVPAVYRDQGRLLHSWNPSITLMRTNVEENRRLGEIFARKANQATGPVAFLFPLRGVSILDGDGEPFCDRQADRALLSALQQHIRAEIPVVTIDANINDALFAEEAVTMMLQLIQQKQNKEPAARGKEPS